MISWLGMYAGAAVLMILLFYGGRAYERHQYREALAELTAQVEYVKLLDKVAREYRCRDYSAFETLYHADPPIVVICESSQDYTPETTRTICENILNRYLSPAYNPRAWTGHEMAHETGAAWLHETYC